MIKGDIIKSSQLDLFDTDEIRLEKMITPCYWVPSYWNLDTWYYQDVIGYSMSDGYGRHEHLGSMLPAVIRATKI
jgi:hypothetical protein